MHSPEVHAELRRLVEAGVSDSEAARRLGVGRSTVRDVRTGRYARRRLTVTCPRCWRAMPPVAFTDERYAYLLGLYLGDGCIAWQPSGRTCSLRLSLDRRYGGIVAEARTALASAFSFNAVSEHAAGPRRSTAVLCVYNRHLPCLFPQHGAGPKHARPIELEPWQQGILARTPWPALRGLIQSDGCRFANRTGHRVYPSYHFSQRSDDIRRIFTDLCLAVGVSCRTSAHHVRVNRREDVALMDRFIGPKS